LDRALARAHGLAGAGRSDGVDPLPCPIGGLHAAVLSLRAGMVRRAAACLAAAVGTDAVCSAGDLQPSVAAPFPLWSNGMAVACDDVPAVASTAPWGRAGVIDAGRARFDLRGCM